MFTEEVEFGKQIWNLLGQGEHRNLRKKKLESIMLLPVF